MSVQAGLGEAAAGCPAGALPSWGPRVSLSPRLDSVSPSLSQIRSECVHRPEAGTCDCPVFVVYVYVTMGSRVGPHV